MKTRKITKYCGATGYTPTKNMIVIDAHEILCLICCEGGCSLTPKEKRRYTGMLKTLKSDPMLPVQLKADLNLACIRTKRLYLSDKLPGIEFDHANQKRDFEVLRRLGIGANTIHPAYFVFNEIFKEIESLEGICGRKGNRSKVWKNCEHYRGGYFEKVRNGKDVYRRGVYRILDLPKKEELTEIKKRSAAEVAKADQLFIRPAHLMCLICVYGRETFDEPLWQDNLVELRRRIQEKPDIPITLVLGSNCDVCPPCPVYDKDRNLCLGNLKGKLRDYAVLEKLDLAPHSTLKASALFKRLLTRIKTAPEICGWGDMRETSAHWRNCADVESGNFEKGREKWLAN